MHRVLQNREKWFNFLLGTGKRLSDDENGEYANFGKAENEEKMFPLPENVIRLLAIHLGVSDKYLEEAQNNGHENFNW